VYTRGDRRRNRLPQPVAPTVAPTIASCKHLFTLKTTYQNSVVHRGKSEAEVTNNKRVRLRYCTVESNYWQTRSIARLLYGSRATCKLTDCINFSGDMETLAFIHLSIYYVSWLVICNQK